MDLVLRPVRVDDEAPFRAAHAALLATDNFALGLNFDEDEPFQAFVDRHRAFALGQNLPDGIVAATFLIACVDQQIVGRVSIRHELNDFLRAEGGHIGYGVLQPYRRRGYATKILQDSLIIARSLGIDPALLVCDDDNVGSITVIERCGGELVDRATDSDGSLIRRYEIAS